MLNTFIFVMFHEPHMHNSNNNSLVEHDKESERCLAPYLTMLNPKYKWQLFYYHAIRALNVWHFNRSEERI